MEALELTTAPAAGANAGVHADECQDSSRERSRPPRVANREDTMADASCPAYFEDLFLHQRDVLQTALPLLDARALARLSAVSRSWRGVTVDERLWEMHCRSDAVCSKWTPELLTQMGGWRKFYLNSANKKHLMSRLFPERCVLTFADIWLTTREVLWENVVGSFIPLTQQPLHEEHLWYELHDDKHRHSARATTAA